MNNIFSLKKPKTKNCLVCKSSFETRSRVKRYCDSCAEKIDYFVRNAHPKIGRRLKNSAEAREFIANNPLIEIV